MHDAILCSFVCLYNWLGCVRVCVHDSLHGCDYESVRGRLFRIFYYGMVMIESRNDAFYGFYWL